METPTKTESLPAEVKAVETLPEHLCIQKVPEPTKGEKAVHHFAHVTVNFWINYIFSLAITDFFLGTKPREENSNVTSIIAEKSGNKAIQRASDWVSDKGHEGRQYIATTLDKKLGMGEKLGKTVADTAMDIFTLMMGGHITASIATYILNRSDKWAKKYDEADDKKRGYTPSAEELAQREARYEYLRNQPKKSAWTVIKSRIIGFVLNTGVLGWLSSKLDLRTQYMSKEELAGKRIGIRSITEGFSNTITNFAASKGAMSDKNLARLRYWSELIPFEGLCTLNTSMALKWVSDDKKETTVHSSKHYKVPKSGTNAPMAMTQTEEVPQANAKAGEGWAGKKVAARGEVQPHEIRNAVENTVGIV